LAMTSYYYIIAQHLIRYNWNIVESGIKHHNI
jgi:hypothetical protein